MDIGLEILSSVLGVLQVPSGDCSAAEPGSAAGPALLKNPLSWRLVTTTAGYFVYDLYVHTVRYEFLPSLVHAGAALVVFLSGIYCGILHYYGAQSPSHPSA